PPADPRKVSLIIEPGMAFGTGHHPTTQRCLIELQELLQPGMSVLDVGTGSGILAIAAVKLGAGYVEAIDVDDVAVIAARENAVRNDMGDDIVFRDRSISTRAGSNEHTFDLVLANLTSR